MPTAEGRAAGLEAETSEPLGKSSLIGKCPYVDVGVNGQIVPCVLDTGSQVTLFSKAFFLKYLGNATLKANEDVPWLKLRAANGLSIPYVGYVVADFSVGGIKIPGRGIIIVKDECMGSEQGILGMNVISQCWERLFQSHHPGLTVFRTTVSPTAGDAWEKAFAVCRRMASEELTPTFQGVARLSHQPPVIIPPRSEMILWAGVTDGTHNALGCVMVEAIPGQEEEWKVARGLATVRAGRVPIRVCNPNPYPVEIPQRLPLAQVVQVNPNDIQTDQELVLRTDSPGVIDVEVRATATTPVPPNSPVLFPNPADSLQGDGLTEAQQYRLRQLLGKWSHVFSQHDEDFGRTNLVQHQIPTGVAAPTRERYRPVPPNLYPELRTLLQGMLDGGVVKESASPWDAPVVLVRKKDGS